MTPPAYTCQHCGAAVVPFQMPPHSCPGAAAQAEADATARTPLPLPRLERRLTQPGDIVRFTERTAQGCHVQREGVVTRFVDGGRSALIRVGDRLIELNRGRLSQTGKTVNQETAQ